jgi:teichuronic acid biosynthesis glycosyltransferase TuaC
MGGKATEERIGKSLRLLLLSNEFPCPAEPNRGIFTGQLALALSKQVDLEVVCPSPWYPRGFSNPGIDGVHRTTGSDKQYWRGVSVQYVRYPMIPLVGRPIQPALMCLGLYQWILDAHRRKPITAINAHWVYPDGVAATWIGRRLRIPVVVTALGSDVNEYSFYRTRRPQVQWALHTASRFTCVSRALKSQLLRLGIHSSRIDVIPNGIDSHLFGVKNRRQIVARKELGLDLQTRCLLYVGRLSPEKGPFALCQAIKMIAEDGEVRFRTIIIGDGPERESLRRYIAANRLESYVHLAGEVPHSLIGRWMEAGDWLCLPSIREGMPNAMLEALSSGLPVIASEVGGVPEVITVHNGILVKPGDPSALAEGLRRASQREWNPEEVASTVKDYSWETAASRYLQSIENAMKEDGLPKPYGERAKDA